MKLLIQQHFTETGKMVKEQSTLAVARWLFTDYWGDENGLQTGANMEKALAESKRRRYHTNR